MSFCSKNRDGFVPWSRSFCCCPENAESVLICGKLLFNTVSNVPLWLHQYLQAWGLNFSLRKFHKLRNVCHESCSSYAVLYHEPHALWAQSSSCFWYAVNNNLVDVRMILSRCNCRRPWPDTYSRQPQWHTSINTLILIQVKVQSDWKDHSKLKWLTQNQQLYEPNDWPLPGSFTSIKSVLSHLCFCSWLVRTLSESSLPSCCPVCFLLSCHWGETRAVLLCLQSDLGCCSG